MKDIFLNTDSLLDELEDKFHSNEKEESLDDPFDIKIDFEENEFYKTVTEDESVDIQIAKNDLPKNTPNNIPISNQAKKGRPKGSLKKVGREKIVNQKLTISLSKEEKELLEKKASEDDRSVSSFIRIKLKELGVFE